MLSAARRNNLAALVHFLRCPRDPNISGEDGETPLHCAVQSGHGEPVGLLLEAGAEVDRYWAAYSGNTEAVGLLLEAGANPDAPVVEDGATPLHPVAAEGHWKMVQMLLNAGANIDKHREKDGSTPLLQAVLRDNLAEDLGGDFVRAARADNLRVVRLLVENGADKDQPTHDGETTLHLAANKGNFNMVQLLVQSGAASHWRANSGATASDRANMHGHTDMVEFLERARSPPRQIRTR